MALHDLLASKVDEVMLRWKSQVRGTLAPESMPTVELADHIPDFLQQIISELREDAGVECNVSPSEDGKIAAEHGEQRLRLGFSLDSVVREYGALRNAIVATSHDAGSHVSAREFQVVFDSIISGIALAVTEYTHQKEVELLRQGNEHFAFIAHELRNPLSSARVAFELLKKRKQLPSGTRAVDALERGLGRTSDLIEQTLQIARMASGVELHPRWTTLQTILEDAELGSMGEAESQGVELRVTIHSSKRIYVDSRLIHSAVGNLLRNAVKYSCSGGTVDLRGSVANGRVVIEVEDCCGGLPPGKVEEAFAPFVRLDQRQSGFGLGLAIAKQAADAHGGNLRVQNLPGKGCLFALELPMPSGEEGRN